ncbi:MAG: hypothetical protein U1F66_01015 [bacterium]
MGTLSIAYYTKSYGIAASAAESPEPQEYPDEAPAYPPPGDTADTYVDESIAPENSVSPSQLCEEVLRWGHGVSENHEIEQKLRLRLYQEAMGLFQELKAQGEGQGAPQTVLDRFALLQTEYQEALHVLEEKAQAKEEGQDSLARIASLDAGIDQLLADLEVAEELQAQLKDYQRQLGKAKSSLELATDPDAVGELEASLEETLAAAEEAVAAGQQAHEEKVAAAQEAIAALQTEAEGAHCGKKAKLKIAKRLTELQAQLEDGSLPPSEILKQLDELKGDLEKAVAKQGRRDAFQGLASLLPAWVYPDVIELAHKIESAMKSGDWHAVDSFLGKMTEDDDMFHYESEIAIEQILGALYYGPAGEDKKELKRLLDCIPEKTRKKMIDTVELNPHDFRGFGLDDNPEQKRSNMVYGNKKRTLALLKDSLK